ncbi:MAG TPA: hypothetical protein P5013_01720 [Methanoregula sp.]|nr:hypothetical protein [Methanoregula sp.]
MALSIPETLWPGNRITPGVKTRIGMDEWGDVVKTYKIPVTTALVGSQPMQDEWGIFNSDCILHLFRWKVLTLKNPAASSFSIFK